MKDYGGYTPAFPKPAKKAKKRQAAKKVTMKECDLQAMAEEYLDVMHVAYIRIPDSLYAAIYNTSINARTKGFISGYLKGLPDLTIFHPTRKIGPYPAVLPLEIKTEAGKLSKSQVDWQDKINTIVTKGWDETKQAIDDFLNYENPF